MISYLALCLCGCDAGPHGYLVSHHLSSNTFLWGIFHELLILLLYMYVQSLPACLLQMIFSLSNRNLVMRWKYGGCVYASFFLGLLWPPWSTCVFCTSTMCIFVCLFFYYNDSFSIKSVCSDVYNIVPFCLECFDYSCVLCFSVEFRFAFLLSSFLEKNDILF